VIQDLWQLSHVTPSYVGRAAAGGILLATGIIDDNAIAIVVAALFLPFPAEVLAMSFGLWSRATAADSAGGCRAYHGSGCRHRFAPEGNPRSAAAEPPLEKSWVSPPR